MLDWLDAIPNLGVPGVPGVLPQKTATFGGTPGVPAGVPGVPEHRAGTPGTPAGTPAQDHKLLKNSQEHREHREHRNLGDPAPILRDWHRHLAPLDFDHAPDGFTRNRWRELCDDSWWIYENFAAQAVRDGWSAHDLFGVLPWHPGWGGLCDRLRGARNLKMETAGQKAVWSSWGVTDWTCIGAGDSLISSGLVPIWEVHT
jgi:hypothetical protein